MTRFWIGITTLAALTACEAEPATAPEEPAAEEAILDTDAPEIEAEPIFRGVGQEPGWIIRIYDDRIVYDADYGERTVTVETPDAIMMNEGRRYETSDLTVEILNVECADTMSGARYAAQVTIIESERSLQGCGGEQLSGPDEGA